jgi:cytidylate kinase|tara:strand:- start:4 stop:702 length:699 start_codon:yes stop_codon:yes gene_type:complete
MRKINIAVDGYSSCGKSTLAQQIAEILGYLYIDSGAMYRAITLHGIKTGSIIGDNVDVEKLKAQLREVHVILQYDPESKRSYPILNGENVSKEIHTMEVANAVSRVSEIKEVREKLVNLQKKAAESKGVVMDGRDIGTVVIPSAELKLFMTADTNVRAERRYEELKNRGTEVGYLDILNNIKSRDERDSKRELSPLVQADDAIILDNTHLTPEEQLTYAIGLINNLVSEQEA